MTGGSFFNLVTQQNAPVNEIICMCAAHGNQIRVIETDMISFIRNTKRLTLFEQLIYAVYTIRY